MADDRSESPGGARANRPLPYRQSPGVSVSTSRDGSKTRFFLRTSAGEVFAFGEQEHFLWKSLDGRTSFAEIERAFAAQFGSALALRDLYDFIAQGIRGGILEQHGDPAKDFDAKDFDANDFEASDFDIGVAEQPLKQPAKPAHGSDHMAVLRREPWTIIVGDPTKVFAILGRIFGPLRYVKWLCVPAAFFAIMIILKHWSQYRFDYIRLVTTVPFWPLMYVYEHVINILARTIEGTIIQAQGGVVRHFGLRFFMGILIRAFIDDHGARSLPERARLWSKGGALMLRLALFDIGMFAWIAFQPAHPALEMAALFFAEIALLTFFLNACPLLTGEGYELLASYLGQHKLVGRSFRLISIRLSGRHLPPAMSATERIGLVFFAVGTILFTGSVLLKVLLDMGNYITTNVQGLGYLIMTVVFASVGVYFYVLVSYHKKVAATLKTIVAEGQKRR